MDFASRTDYAVLSLLRNWKPQTENEKLLLSAFSAPLREAFLVFLFGRCRL
jgi:hypothetical protein